MQSGNDSYLLDNFIFTTTGLLSSVSSLKGGLLPSSKNLYLTSINILKIITIGSGAFTYCTALTSITIPISTLTIGDAAFSNCYNLISVDLPNVTSINGWVFLHCENLTSANMPNVTSIGYSAFSGCSNLTSINMPNVLTIKEYAFSSCISLLSVDLPNVTDIDACAFSGCTNLASVFIPKTKAIGLYTFGWCNNLTSVIMENIKHIGNGAFFRCINLMSITLPNGLITIEDWAFYQCFALKEIFSYSDNPPEAVNNSTFAGVPVNTCTLYIPLGSQNAYANANGWREFMNISKIEVGNDVITTKDGPIAVYPNPVKKELYLKFSIQREIDYTVYNIRGQVVMRGTFRNEEVINVEKLQSGVYWLRTGAGTAKFMKL